MSVVLAKKQCRGCFKHLSLLSYYKDVRGKFGVFGTCKICYVQKSRARYAANIDQKRERCREIYSLNVEKERARSAKYRKENKEACNERIALWASKNPLKRTDISARRRVRLRNNYTEKINYVIVFERDGWTCQLCFEEVNPLLVFPDPMSKSLDHIIPISKNGMHSYDNVQLAHLQCNQKKCANVY